MRLSVPSAILLAAAGLAAEARPRGSESPGAFRVVPLRSLAELRREALAASPPRESGRFRSADLVPIESLDPSIHTEIRYATSENFLGTPVYAAARALLQRPVAEALVRAHRALRADGYGLLIFDAYRPWWVTKLFWDAVPPGKRAFVANPLRGSRHNRGCAVDLTLYALADGRAVEMPSAYDEMTERASPRYAGGTVAQRARRDLLRRAMERQGFRVFATEWWHFDHPLWREYPILNQPL